MAQCNTRFTALYYFPKYDWSNYRPIICSKLKMFCYLVLVNSHDCESCGILTLRGGVKMPSEVVNYQQSRQNSISSTPGIRRETTRCVCPAAKLSLARRLAPVP